MDEPVPTRFVPKMIVKLSSLMLRLSSGLIPPTKRPEFMSEWDGEIWHQLNADVNRGREIQTAIAVFRYSLGSIFHALWLKKKHSRKKVGSMDTALQDFKHAFRRLVKTPSFTLLALAIIGLGIGSNTAIFSIVNAVLFRPLPYDQPHEVVRVFTTERASDKPAAVSNPDFRDFRNRTDLFKGASLTSGAVVSITGSGETEAVFVEHVSTNFFELMGLATSQGRGFAAEEDLAGSEPVAIISHEGWQRRMGSRPDIIGSSIEINGRAVTIVGVGPKNFHGTLMGFTSELWIPWGSAMQLDATIRGQLDNRIARGMFMVGRLQDGVTVEQAANALEIMAAELATLYPESNEDRSVIVMSANDVRIHPFIDAKLYPIASLLMGVVGLVLLVACTNLANLLLVRAGARTREMAVRAAIGATRGRLVRHVLAESIILGAGGGLVGLALARVTSVLILSFKPPIPFPIALDLSMDGRVMAFTLALAVLTGILFGLIPALRASRPELVPALKAEGSSASMSSKKLSLRNLLVVSQVSLSMILLTVAALFVRALGNAQATDPGFETRRAAVAMFDMELAGYQEADALLSLNELVRQVAANPAVEAVGLTDRVPLGASLQTRTIRVDDFQNENGEPYATVDFSRASAGYFEALDIPILRGRNFEDTDVAGGPPVAIVSQAMALKFWGTEDVLGESLVFGRTGTVGVQIVGVAKDTKVRTLGEQPRPYLYAPITQDQERFVTVIARTTGDPAQIPEVLRREIRRLNPRIPVLQATTMEGYLAFSLFAPRMGAMLLSAFGALAIVLAGIGLYGVVATTVNQRSREVGIRVALGAKRNHVVATVVREALWLVLIGSTLGTTLGIAAAFSLKGALHGVSPTDVRALTGVVAVLMLVATVASGIPARRAVRLDPVVALRSD